MKVGEPACRVKSLGNEKTVKRQFYFAKRKITPCRSMLAKPTIQFAWDNSILNITNVRYHQRLCLEAWHMNPTHVLLNRDDETYLCADQIETSTTPSPRQSPGIRTFEGGIVQTPHPLGQNGVQMSNPSVRFV